MHQPLAWGMFQVILDKSPERAGCKAGRKGPTAHKARNTKVQFSQSHSMCLLPSRATGLLQLRSKKARPQPNMDTHITHRQQHEAASGRQHSDTNTNTQVHDNDTGKHETSGKSKQRAAPNKNDTKHQARNNSNNTIATRRLNPKLAHTLERQPTPTNATTSSSPA